MKNYVVQPQLETELDIRRRACAVIIPKKALTRRRAAAQAINGLQRHISLTVEGSSPYELIKSLAELIDSAKQKLPPQWKLPFPGHMDPPNI